MVRNYLHDNDPRVRASALSALLVLVCAQKLKMSEFPFGLRVLGMPHIVFGPFFCGKSMCFETIVRFASKPADFE